MVVINWIKKYFVVLFFPVILVILVIKICILAYKSPQNQTDWLLVYLTAIYAIAALYLALISLKSALAMERSARAMEDSILEARLTRFGQFGATVQFADNETYQLFDDGSATVRILNSLKQRIIDLQVTLWETEEGANNEPEVKCSSMKQSGFHLLTESEESKIIKLLPVEYPESEKRKLGDATLEKFKQRFNRKPKHSLVLVTFYDRFTLFRQWILLFDLQPSDSKPEMFA